MCNHEDTKGFKFCPYCGEELPQQQEKSSSTYIDEWDNTHVYYEKPIIEMDSQQYINYSFDKANSVQTSVYLGKTVKQCFEQMCDFVDVCNKIENGEVERVASTDFFCYRNIETDVQVQSLIAAGIIYPVGDVTFGNITLTSPYYNNETYQDKVRLYAYNNTKRDAILNHMTAYLRQLVQDNRSLTEKIERYHRYLAEVD